MNHFLFILIITIPYIKSSQKVISFIHVPHELIIHIESFNTHNEFEDFINTWQGTKFTIKGEDPGWNAHAIKNKIKRSVALTYASSQLAQTSKDVYEKLKKINWKEHCFTQESFITLWWRIPTISLAYLCNDQQYLDNNKVNNIVCTGMDIAATIFNEQTKKTVFLIYYRIVELKYNQPNDLARYGDICSDETDPSIFSHIAYGLIFLPECQIYQYFRNFTNGKTVIPYAKLPKVRPLTTYQQHVLQKLFLKPQHNKWQGAMLYIKTIIKPILLALSYIKNLLQKLLRKWDTTNP